MKKNWRKALAYMLAVTICFSVVNVPVYAQGNTVIGVLSESETMSEVVTKEMTVEGTVSDNEAETATDDVANYEKETTDRRIVVHGIR